MSLQLTEADQAAIDNHDGIYLCGIGGDYYCKGDYEKAYEYYHLAALFGSANAASNLGYCYMYGRSIEKNMSLAVAYFKLAAEAGVIDAIYKLGQLYKDGNGVKQSDEKSAHYYKMALRALRGYYGKSNDDKAARDNPSLYYACAREMMPGGVLDENIEEAYRFLLFALDGYKESIEDGAKYLQKTYENALEFEKDSRFDQYRK